jgi:hypothetical protein
MDLPADESHPRVPLQYSGQQARLAQNLEPVADSQNQSSGVREFFHSSHHGGKPRDGAGAQVIAVRKTAGQKHRVTLAKLFGSMPQKFDRLV